MPDWKLAPTTISISTLLYYIYWYEAVAVAVCVRELSAVLGAVPYQQHWHQVQYNHLGRTELLCWTIVSAFFEVQYPT
jgi:hypothetical protein